MSLANGVSILFILSKNQLLALLIFAMASFVSFAFIPVLILKVSFLLLALGCMHLAGLSSSGSGTRVVLRGADSVGPEVVFFLIFIFTLFYFTILYWFCHTLT